MDIANQMPYFEIRTVSELLAGQDKIGAGVDEVLERVRRIEDATPNPDQASSRFEVEYRRAVVRNLNKIELFGIDHVSSASKEHRLSVAYVDLTVADRSGGRFSATDAKNFVIHDEFQMLSDQQSHGLNKPNPPQFFAGTTTVEGLLRSTQRLLILGQAGSGKTTLLKWVAVKAAERSFEGDLQSWNDLIPFFIPLRRFVADPLPAPEDFPALVAAMMAGTMPAGWVHACLDDQRAIVLIDSVDEVPEARRVAVRDWLEELIATYPQVRFVVSSRPSAVEDGWLSGESFVEAELQPMTPDKIGVFIEHWHNAIAAELNDPVKQADLPALAQQLRAKLASSRALRNLATSPLLCAVLCALHRDRHQNIPDDRITLYRALCDMLLSRRDLERQVLVGQIDYPVLNDRQKLVLLQSLAYHMMLNNTLLIAFDDAEAQLAAELLRVPNLPANASAERIRKLFVERTGLLREPIANHMDFPHRTLQEYLAAQHAVDHNHIGFLVNHAHDDQWRETIILAAGLADNPKRERLVTQILKRGDSEREHKHRLYLLAIACLEQAVTLSPALQAQVRQRLDQIVPPQDQQAVTAIAAAGELALPYLIYKPTYSKQEAICCVRAIQAIAGEGTLPILQQYAIHADPDITRILLEGVDGTDPEVYGQHLLRHSSATQVMVDSPSMLANLKFLSALDKLILVSIGVDTLDVLAQLPQLTSLRLHNLPQVASLEVLTQLPQLTSLALGNLPQVASLEVLTQLPQLTSLDLYHLPQVASLDGLTQLPSLKELKLSHMPGISTLSESMRERVKVVIW